VVYAGGYAGLFASRNKGRTWSKLLPESSAGHITSIALDPARSNVLYVGGWGANGGLVKTNDGGQTWSKLGLPAGNVGVVEIASTRPQTVYAEKDGLWKSTDGGATWQLLNLG